MATPRLAQALPQLALPDRCRALLALATSTVLWGTSFVAADRMLVGIPPITLAFLRFVVALMVLVPLLLRQGRRPAWGRDAVLIGLTGIALLFVLQNGGVRLAGPTDAALIMSGGVPVLVAVLAAVTLGERMTRRGHVGLVATVAGVGLIFLAASATVGGSLRGDLLLLGSAACGAAFCVIGRRAYARQHVLALLTASMTCGLVFLAPAMIVEVAVVGVRAPSPGDILVLLWLGAGCSGIAFLLWGYGLRHVAAPEAAVIGNLEVPIGIAAAAIASGLAPTAVQLAGGLLVLVGAWLASVPAAPARARWWFVLRPERRRAAA
jgi:drug/metabolite transporter (DMT)-like permease